MKINLLSPKSGALLPRGVPGELCTRGFSVMLGYRNNPQATAEAIDPAGRMHTSDLAVMDTEGYVNIVGRLRDMLVRGSENVGPRQTEGFLYTHAAVEDVRVIGVPSEKFGEDVMAWVQTKAGHMVTPAELEQFCRRSVAHYKIFRYWKFGSAFPMTVTGKIRRAEMRALAVEELGLPEIAKIKTS